jgi:DNA phosphorothioation-associated putative methyltransferase
MTVITSMSIGKLLPNALYVHRTALEALDPLLRVYEGCARAYLGEIDGADLIKLHRPSGKVSYLVYPDFDADPHPALLRSIKLDLRTREIESSDDAASANPPVLHRKETFLLPDDPRRAKFERLTRQEERAGPLIPRFFRPPVEESPRHLRRGLAHAKIL